MDNEKISSALALFAQTLQEQREFIAFQSKEQFCKNISSTFDIEFSIAILNLMEGGQGEVAIIYWLYVWTYFQNIDKIKNAYDAKEMLYLAQQEFLPNIEEEIIRQHEKPR